MRYCTLVLLLAFLFLIPVHGVTQEIILIESWGAENFAGTSHAMYEAHPSASAAPSAQGQTINPISEALLNSAKFYIGKNTGGSPDATLQAQLFATDGTGSPTGSALTVSSTLQASSLSNIQGGAITIDDMTTFMFDNTYRMQQGTTYFIAIVATAKITLDINNNVQVALDAAGTPSHSGTEYLFLSSAWSAHSSHDVIFYVYGISPGFTGGGTSTSAGDSSINTGVLLTGPLAGGTSTILILGGLAAVVFLGRGKRRR